ncbi:RlpA-like double-psi beta-barrel-protein domain-containing protein-containing protein [Triangularia verruculosa]|uniref:RlpA-like double-psi beta-barrel-protein domain-containing protein-containing protein n=1 Tax=Triangularia verruculosa TaxID=2587418 RepID=A0AAN7AQ39_9PEZI|nr:RlpA-like double-psi beta-barrel-protein domain-containing protein-containing protein [Triangularia verruculosa]
MANQPISPPTRNSTLEIERIRYDPEWEIPTNYPPRKPDNPFLAKIKSFLPLNKPIITTATSSTSTPTTIPHHHHDTSKETLPPTSTSTTTTSTGNGHNHQTPTPLLDRYFPPEKKYLGRFTRLTFLLTLLLLLILLTLALGLGLGLGLKHHRKEKSAPLPWSDAGRGVQSGELTYYNPSFGAGACGLRSSDNDSIAAISHELFDAGLAASGGTGNPNENVLCGRTIRVWEEGRESDKVVVEVVDRCTGCGVRDLDLSDGVFGAVTGEGGRDRGRVRGRWEWV